MGRLKVAVLMGGPSSEHEISMISGREAIGNLDPEKYQTWEVAISKDAFEPFELIKRLRKIRPDVVFLALHGRLGEDGVIQGLLEFLGIPYTGSGVLASALGLDKIKFKKMIEKEGIETPKWYWMKGEDQATMDLIDFSKSDWVVKPFDQGSSVGVSIVKKKENLAEAVESALRFSDKVIVEEYIEGREVSCGVLGNDRLIALPIIEIRPKNEFFDMEAKYQEGRCDEIVPANLDYETSNMIQVVSMKVFELIGCRGLARIDMIVKGKKAYVLEINTIPGLTSQSLLPKEAMAAGISYGRLLDKILEMALE